MGPESPSPRVPESPSPRVSEYYFQWPKVWYAGELVSSSRWFSAPVVRPDMFACLFDLFALGTEFVQTSSPAYNIAFSKRPKIILYKFSANTRCCLFITSLSPQVTESHVPESHVLESQLKFCLCLPLVTGWKKTLFHFTSSTLRINIGTKRHKNSGDYCVQSQK